MMMMMMMMMMINLMTQNKITGKERKSVLEMYAVP